MDFLCYEDADNFKNTVDHFGGQNQQFSHYYLPLNNHFGLKIVILTPKMVNSIFEIICIFTAAKIHISNFVDTSFDPDYCTPSKIVPHRAKNS